MSSPNSFIITVSINLTSYTLFCISTKSGEQSNNDYTPMMSGVKLGLARDLTRQTSRLYNYRTVDFINLHIGGNYFVAWIRIRKEQDGDLWSAYCDEAGLASCGTTEEEAVANLKHAFIAYCRALAKRGILETRLEEQSIPYEAISPRKQGTARGELSPVLVA